VECMMLWSSVSKPASLWLEGNAAMPITMRPAFANEPSQKQIRGQIRVRRS